MVAGVKDGKICTLVQAADYDETEYNPRGCLKGTTRNTEMYGKDRLTKPLVRDGKFTEGGKLREASWEEALDRCAEMIKEITEKYGEDAIGMDYQVPPLNYVNKGTLIRLTNRMGWTNFPGYEMNGDLPIFFPETFGCQTEELESYQWADAKLSIIYGSNIYTTRMPDSHMLMRSQENGGKVVYLDHNHSVTASKADKWLRPAPGSDVVFALAMAKIIIDDGAYDRRFMQTYTDAPILVNPETKMRIRTSEVEGLEAPADLPEKRESFVYWNGSGPAVLPASRLDDLDDAVLEGTFDVRLKDGTTVKAKPVFQLIVEHLQDYGPDRASELTQIPKEDILEVAHMAETIKPMHIMQGGSAQQWHHGDMKGRAFSLVAALTGNLGKLGAGISCYIGQYKVRFKPGSWFAPPTNKARFTPFHYFCNGPTETMSAAYPKNGFRMLITGWANPYDQHAFNNAIVEKRMSGEIEYQITCDFLHTTTVDYADVVLPGCAWYEKTDVCTTPLHPYVQLQQKACEAPGESRPEIWIFTELAHRLGVGDEFPDRFAPEQSEAEIEKVVRKYLETGGPALEGITLEQLRQGPVKMRHTNPGDKRIPFYDQIQNRALFPPITYPNPPGSTDHFVKSGRMELFKDEPMFQMQGEQLPLFKPLFEDTEYAMDPEARTKYPFIYLTRNSIYRIHSNYSSNPIMLELQDNMPLVWMHPDDAQAKGLKEGDHITVFNNHGQVDGKLAYEPGLWPGQVVFEMGWWARYTHDNSYNSLIYPFVNPVHEQYSMAATWSPVLAFNECVCDVKKFEEGGRQ
jgi:anaerobic selenocysteine-containing dehydrogenase